MDFENIVNIIINNEKKSPHDITFVDYDKISKNFNLINGNFDKIKEYSEKEKITKNIAFLGDSFIIYEKGD